MGFPSMMCGRVVDGGSLENCWAATSRGFESLRLRKKIRQLVAKATGCFWFPARRKLAFAREGGRKQPGGTTARQLPSILCKDSPTKG